MLSLISYASYRSFNQGGSDVQKNPINQINEDVSINDHVNEENASQTLILKGLPFQATELEIREFFKGFDLKDDCKSVLVEQKKGRKTGKGAVIFKSSEQAQQAKQTKNFGKIGASPRYVVLCDKDDDFFQGVVCLPNDQ